MRSPVVVAVPRVVIAPASLVAVSLIGALVAGCGPSKAGRIPVDPPPELATPAPPPVTPPVSAPAEPAPPAFRLPGDVRPTRGELELTIVPDREALDGIARYAVEVTRPTATVWLNATGLTVASATVGGQLARVVAGGEHFVGLALPAPLAAGPTTLEIRYRAPIARDRSVGVYADREGDDWYAYTFFEAIDARRAFPGFDEPGFKIPWQLRFHVRKDHVALGNTAVTAEVDEPDGMKRVELATTRPLPSYLVAFVVGPFELVDGGTAGRAATPIRFIVPRGRAAETRYAREVTPRVVAALESYFDMAYPYGKLDVAVVPRYWGTMEHPGIVAMGQPLTLIPPAQETPGRKRGYTNILAHELAHYWFGDLVTMAWWDDTWLNEGLATWLDGKITDAAEPSWRFLDGTVGRAQSALAADELPSARAMRQPVEDLDGIQASFDGDTTYDKGAAVFTMFETWLGAERWRDVIRAHVRGHEDGNATADDFLATVARVAGDDTAAALRTFLVQPGAPLVAMELRCTAGKGTLHLRQRPSLATGVTPTTAQRWSVPVCVRAGRGKAAGARACTLLTGAEGELALPGGCPGWLVTHADGAGYYRASVTGVTGTPPARAVALRERLRALGELAAARSRGEVSVTDQLTAAVALVGDRDPRIALGAAGLLGVVRTDVLDDELHDRYVRMIDRTLGPRARAMGWKRRPGDDDDAQALRLALLSTVAVRDRALATEARALLTAALADPAAVPDDVAGIAMQVAARHGDRELFDRLVAAARATPDRRQRARLFGAVGGFEDPALAAQARLLVMSPGLDLRETRVIVFTQLSRRETRADAWTWIKQVLPRAIGMMREDEAAALIGFLAGSACTPADRAEAEALLQPLVADIDGAGHALATGLADSDRCVADQARDVPALRAFLDGHRW